MIVISTRDFRANQTKFLEMANDGEEVVLKSRGKGSFRIVPVSEKEPVAEERDLMTEFRGALQEVKDHLEGKRKLKTIESLIDELRDSTL